MVDVLDRKLNILGDLSCRYQASRLARRPCSIDVLVPLMYAFHPLHLLLAGTFPQILSQQAHTLIELLILLSSNKTFRFFPTFEDGLRIVDVSLVSKPNILGDTSCRDPFYRRRLTAGPKPCLLVSWIFLVWSSSWVWLVEAKTKPQTLPPGTNIYCTGRVRGPDPKLKSGLSLTIVSLGTLSSRVTMSDGGVYWGFIKLILLFDRLTEFERLKSRHQPPFPAQNMYRAGPL